MSSNNQIQQQKACSVEKDLEKFIKLFALKTAQVVVQSRLGEKMQTQWNPSDGNDWFNIVVEDHPDVNAETKRVLALSPTETILQRLPMCIEISLRTAEGDQMVLEVWTLDLQTAGGQQKKGKENIREDGFNGSPSGGSNGTTNFTNGQSEQHCLKATHAIYNRMGILLKSLISLTRAVPAYKLSRVQCSDSYSIYYRIYVGQPHTLHLGEGHKVVRIGQLNTILGNLVMSVAYRTKMTITPTSITPQTMRVVNGNSAEIMMDSNHFQPSAGGVIRKLQTKTGGLGCFAKGLLGGQNAERKIIDLEKPMRPGAFTEIGKLRQYTEEDFVLPEVPPFEWILRRSRRGSFCSDGGTATTSDEESYTTNNCYGKSVSPTTVPYNQNSNNELHPDTVRQTTHSFGKSPTGSSKSQSPPKVLFVPIVSSQSNSDSKTSTCNHSPTNGTMEPPSPTATAMQDEDNLLKELYFPFASSTSHVNDLAKFYRDCYYAPPLRGLNPVEPTDSSSIEQQMPEDSTATRLQQANRTNNVEEQRPVPVDVFSGGCGGQSSRSEVRDHSIGSNYSTEDLTRQLQLFETSLEDYEKLVSQLSNLTASSASTGSRSSGGALQLSN